MIKSSILALALIINSVPTELIQMRNLYEKLEKNEKNTRELDALAKSSTIIPASLKEAYLAVTHMALAQYYVNPVSKWKGFNEGKNRLEKIIQNDSTNLEIRYMRLTIQQHAPSLLGYNTHIKSDRSFLILNLNKIKTSDADLFVRIYTYLLLKGKLNENDKSIINNGL